MNSELNMIVDCLENVILSLLPIVFLLVALKVFFGFINRVLRDDSFFSFASDDLEPIEDTSIFKNEEKKMEDKNNNVKYWDCAWCGTKHIKVKHLNCPNCCGTRL